MKDIMGMMKNLQGMQAKMQEFQDNLGNLLVEGRSGGGLVTVTLSGKGELKGLKIDPSLFREDDVEVLEDLIVAAHADAKFKAETEANAKMQEITAGLPLPPGMKLPF
jgi:DNA-binding YbaB/EbfC family protein